MAIINDALWSEVFITYEDGDTETIESFDTEAEAENRQSSLNLGLDMWTLNGENVKLTNL
jgi:hypothetical protein